MDGHATLDDVAKAAGVHKSTASRALNDETRSKVNAKTAKRVLRVADELGYVPNAVARGLRTKASMTVGVIIPDLLNPIFPPMISGMDEFLRPKGYTVLMASAAGNDAAELAAFESMRQRRVDGFIFANSRLDSSVVQDRMRESGSFAVMVNREPKLPEFPVVGGDDESGIRQAIAHLRELGHRRLGLMPGPRSFSTTHRRTAAFDAAVREDDKARSVIIPTEGLTIDGGRKGMRSFLDGGGELPSGIVAGNDLVALGAIRELRARGLSCPDDVSIVGFNDMPLASDLDPALTSVHVPLERFGYESAALLLRGIEADQQEAVQVRLPVELIVRASTAPLSAAKARQS